MKKALVLCFVVFLSTSLFAKKGKIRIATNIDSGYIYIDGKKKAMVGEGYTNIYLDEGEYEVKIEKISNNGEWRYIAYKNIFIGENTSVKFTIKTKKVPTEKRKAKERTLLNERKVLKKYISQIIKNGSNRLKSEFPGGMPAGMATGEDVNILSEYVINGLKGKKPFAYNACAGCHGNDGEGFAYVAPPINKLPNKSLKKYLKRSLKYND